MGHRAIAVLLLSLALALPAPIPLTARAASAEPVLADAIAPGIVTGSIGLGADSVAVPSGDYATLLISSIPPLPGRTIQIWQEHAPNEWTEAVTRRSATDGTVRYFVRITRWTALQARYVADRLQPPLASHGRIATVEPHGRTAVHVTCDDFAAVNGGPDIIRAVGVALGSTLEVSACVGTAGSWSLTGRDGNALHLVTSAVSTATHLVTWVARVRQVGSDALEFDEGLDGAAGPHARSLIVLLQMPALPVAVTSGVAFTPLVPCGVAGRCQIRADVYAPKAPGPWPVVVLLRGGPGGLGSRSDVAVFAARIASQGIVVYNADYRDDPASGAAYPRAFDDAACAVRFARATAARYGGNPSRVSLVGHSLGAYVGSVVALSADAFASLCLATGNGAPDAFIGIAGAYLLGEQNLQGDFTSVLGGPRTAEPGAWQGGDPFESVGRRPGATFRLVHGSADQIVEPAASRSLESALEKAGFDTSLTLIPGASHTSLIEQSPDVDRTMAVILATVR